MKRFDIALVAIALAWPHAGARADEPAILRSLDGAVQCPGEWYWNGKGKRVFWTQGYPCALTRYECLQGLVVDANGAHRVISCSADEDLSAGRKAEYRP